MSDFWENFFGYIFTIALCILVSIGAMVLAINYADNRIENPSYFEYVDFDGKSGTAMYCSYKFHGAKSGGQGTPVCELYDGTVVMVKQYKYVGGE